VRHGVTRRADRDFELVAAAVASQRAKRSRSSSSLGGRLVLSRPLRSASISALIGLSSL
jgi:hypothetical protein